MRVITGTAKGRRLETLEGEDVRPTTERIKEAVFVWWFGTFECNNIGLLFILAAAVSYSNVKSSESRYYSAIRIYQ